MALHQALLFVEFDLNLVPPQLLKSSPHNCDLVHGL